MEDWVLRGLERWPNVPALFGWLALDRRGRWLIRGEAITRPQIIETIERNYAADEHGRWYFQNGAQRGYIELECAPFVLRSGGDGQQLLTHTGLAVERPAKVFLDEEGSVLLATEWGAGLIADADLDWVLQRLQLGTEAVGEAALAEALALPSTSTTALTLRFGDAQLPVMRLDAAEAPYTLAFVRRPLPREGERWSGGGSV